MEHSTYKEMLSALLDGELGGAEREAALAHLDGCADCRAYFDELAALRAAFGELEELDAPEGFAAGVMARLRAEGMNTRLRAESAPKTRQKRMARRGYAALAACAAVALLAVCSLPNALRMGGNSAGGRPESAAADSASSTLYDAPAAASGASAAPAEAPQATDADPGYGYAYTDGGAGGMAMQSVPAEESGVEDRDAPAAMDDNAANSVANGAASSAAIVTTRGETSGEKYAAEDEKLPISDSGGLPMQPLSRPEAWDGEYPVLTLTGADAESWLAEHGWQGESGAWYVEADALRALPETVTVLYSELTGDYDGAVLVELWPVEPSAEEAEP